MEEPSWNPEWKEAMADLYKRKEAKAKSLWITMVSFPPIVETHSNLEK